MSRTIGTVSRGVRAPIIRQGDDMAAITVASVIEAAQQEGFSLRDRDIVGVTEAVVARAQGNYADVGQIAQSVRERFGSPDTLGVLFPILSRNRFAVCLRGIAGAVKKIVLMLSYPADEVGNPLFSAELLDTKSVDPYNETLSLQTYRALFGEACHPFTGVDYVQYYGDLIREAGAEVEIIFSNRPQSILNHTRHVLCCDIHTRARTKRILQSAGAKAFGLDDILTQPVNGSGFHAQYGLLGSNKATETSVKLFPRDCEAFVSDVQDRFLSQTGKHIEVLVYGDGAFRDPIGKIWELADPVVSPGYTAGLEGTPNELKIKYLADNDFAQLGGEELRRAIAQSVRNKKKGSLVGDMASEGTTPRRLTDLIGSLCDLTSGSGDKGTPIILIQGYFDTYAD